MNNEIIKIIGNAIGTVGGVIGGQQAINLQREQIELQEQQNQLFIIGIIALVIMLLIYLISKTK